MSKQKTKFDWMTIGQISERTGIKPSAIRFYETVGLISADRDPAGQRRFRRADIRRLSFIVAAQTLGLTLKGIGEELKHLPKDRPLNSKDWKKISTKFREDLNARIESLIRLRDNLEGCIGCGCLSMENCALFNPQDGAGLKGAGPRYLKGDSPSEVNPDLAND